MSKNKVTINDLEDLQRKELESVDVEPAVYIEAVVLFIQKYVMNKNYFCNYDHKAYEILDLLDWNIIRYDVPWLIDVYNLILAMFQDLPHRICDGVYHELIWNMMVERKRTNLLPIQNIQPSALMAQMIADFLPALPRLDFQEDTDVISSAILLSGPHFELRNDVVVKSLSIYDVFPRLSDDYQLPVPLRELLVILDVTFKPVFSICKHPCCHFDYHALLLKIILWAHTLNLLEDIPEIMQHIKNMVSSTEPNKVLIGLSIMYVMFPKHFNVFHEHNFLEVINKARSIISPRRWVEAMHEILSDDDDHRALKMLIFCTKDSTFFPFKENAEKQAIYQILSFIFKSKYQLRALKLNYSALKTFVRYILNIPKSFHFEEIRHYAIDAEGIKNFQYIVSYVIGHLDKNIKTACTETLDHISGYLLQIYQMPSHSNDIELDSRRSPNFDPDSDDFMRVPVFQHIKSRSNLECDREIDSKVLKTVLQALILAVILHEVNENWGALFGTLSTKRLIARSAFVSDILTDYFNCAGTPYCTLISYRDLIASCDFSVFYFLLPFSVRRHLSNKSNSNRRRANFSDINLLVAVDRNDTIRGIVEDMSSANRTSRKCYFTFSRENCSYDETDEFYIKFSKDCQKKDLKFWIDGNSNGSEYVNPPGGLFPRPYTSLNHDTALQLKAFGRVMARCIRDDRRMDMNFSKAFYKRLFGFSSINGGIALENLKDIMPHVYESSMKLLESLKIKRRIEKDESLSAEKKLEAISQIKIDGYSFEDLRVNFTVPEFPEIEMKEGGKDILLTLENVEEYLKLVVWWIVYKGPEESFKAISEGFKDIIHDPDMKILYLDELECFFSDSKAELWTVDYLRDNCIYPDSPAVQYLFEVLTTFSASEQKQFIQFVTSLQRFPIGGLKNVWPKINIKMDNSSDNPDSFRPKPLTLTNTLTISEYSSRDVLRDQLSLAIKGGLYLRIPFIY